MESSSFVKGMVFGGCASCVAETLTLPIDVVKVRLQVQGRLQSPQAYRGVLHAIATIYRTEGPQALLLGLSPALLRQSTYGSLRYGLYTPFKRALGVEGTDAPLWAKIAAGCGSGALSSALCNPTDLVKIRMQADGMRALISQATHTTSQTQLLVRRNYTSVFDAFRRIAREEGLRGLYKGVGPTCTRATVLAAAELSSYDELKRCASGFGVGDGVWAHLLASLGAGFIATLASNPFDFAKSRVMSQPVGLDGQGLLYRGMWHCLWKSARSEGVLVLWSGFKANYGRAGPNTVIVYLLMEQLKVHFDKQNIP